MRSRHPPEIPDTRTLLEDDFRRTHSPKGLRMTEQLRDKLRPGWLRLKK